MLLPELRQIVLVIKPSGIKSEDLTPEKMVVVNLDGEIPYVTSATGDDDSTVRHQ